jgi:hypothetical protein
MHSFPTVATVGCLLSVMPGAAHGFCGTYVGTPGSTLTNEASTVVLARQGNTTTVTLANDFEGDLDEFALIVPVPQVLQAHQVGTVDAELFDWLENYTKPRVVSYSCEDAMAVEHRGGTGAGCGFAVGGAALGCSAMDASPNGSFDSDGGQPGDWADTADGVNVEAFFNAAEYDIFILSAEGADGLTTWLDKNNFAIPSGGEDIMQEYIDGGSYFMAAKINAQRVSGRQWLSPLQWSYESPFFGLPVRIGTISSAGVQEVNVYTITAGGAGETGISNYAEMKLDDECMYPGDEYDSFSSFYEDYVPEHADRAEWQLEYSWPLYSTQKCDPCTVEPGQMSGQEVQYFGFQAQTDGWYQSTVDAHLTRMRLRYTPDQVDEDLVLYSSGLTGAKQLRFIEYSEQLEFQFPVCGQGYREDPGQCDMPTLVGGGCATPVAPLFSTMAVSLLIGLRRRQEA